MIRVFNVDEEGRFGGPEKRICLVADSILGLGIDTTVVAPEFDSDFFKKYLITKNVKFIIVDITRLSLESRILYRYVIRFPIEIYLLYRLLVKSNPDLVHVNGASQFKVALAAKLASRPVVWHLNNTYLKHPVKVVFSLVSKFCIDGVIYAGSRAGEYYKVAERFRGLPSENIEAPVSGEFFSIPIRNCVKGRLEIVCVGGVNEAKGITDIVLCASECRRRGLSIRFRVAGKLLSSQRDYFEEVQRLVEAHSVPLDILEFLGEVEDIPGLLADADVALTMSHREASPAAVWEGLAAGRIVVTTDVGSVTDHIEHRKNGFVVAPKDVHAVVDIIESIARNKIDLNGMREAARATADRSFSVRVIAEKHKNIYNRVLGNCT